MVNLAIMDTGYLTTTTTSGTQAPMANSGNVINLKTAEITFQGGGNVDNTPIINSNTETALNFGSISNAKITIQGLSDRTDVDDVDDLVELDKLRKTYGIKLLYATSTSTTIPIIYSLGTTDTHNGASGTFLGVGILHLHIRVTNFQVRQVANSKLLKYTIEAEVTG